MEALRLFLATFRLPGEAQCIERLMESFAEAYFKSQPAEAAEGNARWVPRERSEEDRLKPGGPEDAAGEEPTRVLMAASFRGLGAPVSPL